MSNKTKQTLEKILLRMERTLGYCAGQTFASFQTNQMLQEACVFNILQIGELANAGLDDRFTAEHRDIAWHQMYGMRNRIAHDYDGIRLTIVWQTITEDFPLLIPKLKDILDSLPDEASPDAR